MRKNYWTEYHENRKRVMYALEGNERELHKMECMDERENAIRTANSRVKEIFIKALNDFESIDSSSALVHNIEAIICTRQNPYSKVTVISTMLSNHGIDISSYYWQIVIDGCKREVSEITNPNKFY